MEERSSYAETHRAQHDMPARHLVVGTLSIGEQVPTPRGELRIVDTHPGNWASVTLHVFEHLLELDKDGKLVPRLATSWQWRNDRTLDVTLRQGVTFQNGEVFDAEIVKLN